MNISSGILFLIHELRFPDSSQNMKVKVSTAILVLFPGSQNMELYEYQYFQDSTHKYGLLEDRQEILFRNLFRNPLQDISFYHYLQQLLDPCLYSFYLVFLYLYFYP